jgi:hypothetical protein
MKGHPVTCFGPSELEQGRIIIDQVPPGSLWQQWTKRSHGRPSATTHVDDDGVWPGGRDSSVEQGGVSGGMVSRFAKGKPVSRKSQV